jgi:hypothetical protein
MLAALFGEKLVIQTEVILRASDVGLVCPACGKSLPTIGESRHLQCSSCRTNLVIGFKYHWLYTTICIAGGLAAAYAQKLDEPLFALSALIYAALFLVLGTRILLPHFPLKVEVARDHIQKLGI